MRAKSEQHDWQSELLGLYWRNDREAASSFT